MPVSPLSRTSRIALAEPFTPQSDDDVVETLAASTVLAARAGTSRASVGARGEPSEPAVAIAANTFDFGRVRVRSAPLRLRAGFRPVSEWWSFAINAERGEAARGRGSRSRRGGASRASAAFADLEFSAARDASDAHGVAHARDDSAGGGHS